MSAGRPLAGWALTTIAVVALGGWFAARLRENMRTREALATERHQRNEPPTTAAAHAVSPAAIRWRPSIILEGTLQPIREADLGFKVPGRLESIKVRLGAHVAQGATLARLEHGEAKAQLEAARAQVRASSTQLDFADDASKRMSALADRGATPVASERQAAQQRAMAEAQVATTQAQEVLAEEALRNSVLVAPFGGIVTRVPSGTGSIVTPGTILFHVADTSAFRLVGTVAESEAPLIKPGAAVELAVDGKLVTGRVTAVVGAVDAATRRVPVEAEIANQAQLLAGSLVRAKVMSLDELDLLRLPGATLRPGSQDEVLVVDRGRLSRRRITFFTDGDGSLLVRSGLTAEERVLVSPTAEARDGDPVRLAD